jgi:hypothetical protein
MKIYKAVIALMFRFLLFLLVLRFFYFDWLRYVLDGQHPLTDNRELLAPLDPLTSGTVPAEPPSATEVRPVTAPGEPAKSDDPWLRSGERLIVAADAPEGSYPMVKGVDGRLYQLTPGGGRHPVDKIDLPSRLSESEFEGRLFKWDADGRLTPDVRRRFVP